jgi:hypothetical protein
MNAALRGLKYQWRTFLADFGMLIAKDRMKKIDLRNGSKATHAKKPL